METKIRIKKTSVEMIQYLIEIKKEAQEETRKYISSTEFQEDLKKLKELKNAQK